MSERNKFGDIFLETPNYLSLKSLNLKTSALENYNSAIIYCGTNFHINKIAKCLLTLVRNEKISVTGFRMVGHFL